MKFCICYTEKSFFHAQYQERENALERKRQMAGAISASLDAQREDRRRLEAGLQQTEEELDARTRFEQ